MIRRLIVVLSLAALVLCVRADDSPLALLRESAELVIAGKATEATAKYTQALADSGENTPERRRIFLLQRGLELWARGRADLAAQEIPTLRRIVPDAPEAAALEAFLLLENGQPEAALEKLPTEDEATPFVTPVRVLAMLRVTSFDYSSALDLAMAEITTADPDNYLRSRALGEWSERTGDARTALAGWQMAAQALPAHAATREKFTALAVAYATNPPGAAFEKYLGTLVTSGNSIDATDSELPRLLAAARDRHDSAAAWQCAMRLTLAREDDAAVQLDFARASNAILYLEPARGALTALLEREPANATALALLAENRQLAGDLDAADKLLARVRELAPNQLKVGDTNLLTLATRVAAARAALRTQLTPLLAELRGHPAAPETWAKLAEFWLALEMPGRAYACLLTAPSDPANAGLALRFWVRLAERFPGDKLAELLARHADDQARTLLETDAHNAAAWATRLSALRILQTAPLDFLRQHRDLLVSAQAVGVVNELAPYLARQQALQAATVEEFDAALKMLAASGATEDALADLAPHRARLEKAQPRYLAAMAARKTALEKKDWPALAAADRDAAQVTPSGSAYCDLTAEREMALGYDAFARGLPGSATKNFEAAAAAAFSFERIEEAKARAKETRAAGQALLAQTYAAKEWDAFVRAVDDWEKLEPLSADLAIRRITALVQGNHLPEAVASAESTLARTDLTDAQRKAIATARDNIVAGQRKRQLRRAWQLWLTGRYDSALAVIRALSDSPFADTNTRLLLADRLVALHRKDEALAIAADADRRAENRDGRVRCLMVIFALHGAPPADVRSFSPTELGYVIGQTVLGEVSAVVKSSNAPHDAYLDSWLSPVLSRRLAHIRELADSLQTRNRDFSGYAASFADRYKSLQGNLSASWTSTGDDSSPFDKGSWMNPYDSGPSYLAQQNYDAGVNALVAEARRESARLTHLVEHDRAIIEQIQKEAKGLFAP